MSTPLVELGERFAAMLVLLGAMGAGPASMLPAAFPRSARLCLAPVLGLCLAACLFTTLEWFVAGGKVAFVVPLAGALSLGVAFWRARVIRRTRRSHRQPRSSRGPVVVGLQVLCVCAAAFLPVATALSAHHSVGPMSYEVFDGPGYVANAEAAETVSIHQAASDAEHDHMTNYVLAWWAKDAASSNRLDYAPLVAAVDALLGLEATSTYAADLLAVVAAGGLGMYGAVMVATSRRSGVFATLAGMAFGGSFFLQLVFDGSQAAITGLAVLVPLGLVVCTAAMDPAPPTLFVCALLVAGLATLYPIFLFPLALAAVAVSALALLGGHRRSRVTVQGLGRAAVRLGAVLGGAALLDVVATVRDVASLSSIATGGGVLSSFPAYHLGAGVVSSWLLQTRDLYGVAFGPQSPFYDVVPALLIPVAVVVAAAPGLRRNPVAWLLLWVVALSIALGAYEALHNGCGYCEDRSMLASVPPLVFLVFTGLGTVYASARALARGALVVVLVSYLGFVAYDAANARARYSAGSYYLTSSLRALVARIPAGSGPVELEGFGADPSSLAAEPYLYELLLERTGAVSVATSSEATGLAEDWGPEPLRPPYFRPDYRYVLTRLAAVAVSRREVASSGPAALEVRVRPDDVTVETGLSFASLSSKAAEVSGPVVFVVAGPGSGPEVVRSRFELSPWLGSATGAKVRAAPPGVVEEIDHGRELDACVPVEGRAPERIARLKLGTGAGLTLEAMAVAPGHC